MTARQAKLGVDVFTILVAASIGIALAGLTWRLFGDPGQRFGSAPVAARPAKPVDIDPLIALAPFGASITAPAASQSTDQSIVLRGILLAIPQSASSALISVGGAAPQAFYVGQAVGPGTIESIAVDHVIFTGGGGRQILNFPETNGSSGSAPSSSGPTPAPSQPGAAPDQPVSMAGTAAFLSSLGASVGGDGLHISAPADRAKSAGLRPGDVVQRINGSPISDLLQSPTAIQTIQASGTAQMTVSRGDQQVTLNVPTK